jgi:hypothetical protein
LRYDGAVSIVYYAVARRDPKWVEDALDGKVSGPAIDGNAIRAALRGLGFRDDASTTLEWDRDSYVNVDVDEHYVEITHGTSGGDRQIAKLEELLGALSRHGLHVWDPQQDDWFPTD